MASETDTDPPNVLYVMADDHAANAIGAYGSRLTGVAPTENLDGLAREGVRLDNCVCENSICTPSRATILTGQYSHEHGVRTLDDDIDPERRHLAHHLQDAGYRTGLVGKWHLGTEPQGFDYYDVLPGQGRYHDPILKEKGREWDTDGRECEGYSADVITDRAIEWIEGDVGDGSGHDDPFFLQCHFKAPHWPWEYPDRHEDLFEDMQIPEPSSLFEDKSHRSEATREMGPTVSPEDTTGGDMKERTREGYQEYLKNYLRTVKAIDDNVGRLLDHLDEAGLRENTLVVYTSDQGMFLGEHDHVDKRWMYEEPLRMPFLARYPGEIPADSFVEDIVSNVDFAPTILDYAGVEVPDRMQGRSVRENLAGDPDADSKEAVYYRYWMHRAHLDVPAHYGLRTDRYKLIFFYGLPLDATGASDDPSQPGWELYDLKRDPHELNNVYDDPAYADVREDLKDRLAERKRELGDDDSQYPELVELKDEHW